jgi:hypothetical protein
VSGMTVADVLEAAADALFVYGRCTGYRHRPDGTMCVVGAVEHVLGQSAEEHAIDPYSLPAVVALDRYLGQSTEYWNDKWGPEGDALVIDTLKRCAKELREAESQ